MSESDSKVALTPEPKFDAEAFCDYLKAHEDWLMERILGYAIEHGYSEFTSTLVEPWRASIVGLMEPLLKCLETEQGFVQINVRDKFQNDPGAEFGRQEARLHRHRGVPLPMFMGFFKYYRKTFLDLVKKYGGGDDLRDLVILFFDRIELAYGDEWCELGADKNLEELRTTNRGLTNEKNKYLTIFESLKQAALFVDTDGCVVNANLEAIRLFPNLDRLGKRYYKDRATGDPIRFDQLEDAISEFLRSGEENHSLEAILEASPGKRSFQIDMRLMKDTSRKFMGAVIVLNDLTEHYQLVSSLDRANSDYRQAHDELLGANTYTKILVQSIPIPLFHKDRDGVYIGCNEHFCKFMGMTMDEVVGHQLDDLHEKDSWNLHRSADLKALSSDEEVSYQTTSNIDGREVVYEVHKSRFRVPETGEWAIVGTIVDLTESHRSARKLERLAAIEHGLARASLLLLDKVSNEPNIAQAAELGDAIGILRQATRSDCVFFAEKASRDSDEKNMIVRHSSGVGRSVGEAIPPDSLYRAFQLDGSSQRFYFPIGWGKGRSGVLGFECVDDRKSFDRSEVDLLSTTGKMFNMYLEQNYVKRQMDLLATAVDSTEDGILITRAQWPKGGPEIVFASQGFCEMTGYMKDELVGNTPRLLQSEKTNISAIDDLKRNLKSGRSFHGETTNRRKDGSHINVDWKVSPIKDSNQNVTHYVSVQRDVTEQRALKARMDLSSKMESVGQLAAGIAHEINTPSQFINDNLQYFEDCWGDMMAAINTLRNDEALQGKLGHFSDLFKEFEEEIPSAISDAVEGVARIKSILSAMREFSHPQQDFAESDLNHAIKTTVTVARNEWKYNSEVVLELDEDLPGVPCIIGDVNQAVLNLVVNAAHAITSRHGEGEKSGRIIIRTETIEDQVRISIQDNGTGIPEDMQGRVFDPFFTTKAVGKGTGQGLYLAHNAIVNRHEGSLYFETEQDVGTTFIIELPLHRKEEEEQDEATFGG